MPLGHPFLPTVQPARFETGAMLTTSNRSIAEWGVVFADPMDATAILDRFLHHNHVHPW